jgi:hypothetical protein
MANLKRSNGTVTTRTDDSPILTTPALGTPSAGVVTNLSGVLPSGVTGGSGLTALGTVATGTVGTAVNLAGVTVVATFRLGTGDTSTTTMSLSADSRYMALSMNFNSDAVNIYPVLSILRFDGTSGSVESENNSFAGSTVWNWTFGTSGATTVVLRVNHGVYTTAMQMFKLGGV